VQFYRPRYSRPCVFPVGDGNEAPCQRLLCTPFIHPPRVLLCSLACVLYFRKAPAYVHLLESAALDLMVAEGRLSREVAIRRKATNQVSGGHRVRWEPLGAARNRWEPPALLGAEL